MHNIGIGFVGALQLLFIALKLMKYIDWSWWEVLLPLELSMAIPIVIILGLLLTLFIQYIFYR